MSALVVMMLMLYALLVVLALLVWSTLTLRGRRPVPLAGEARAQRRDDLPEVPAAFAVKADAQPDERAARRLADAPVVDIGRVGRAGRSAPRTASPEAETPRRHAEPRAVRPPQTAPTPATRAPSTPPSDPTAATTTPPRSDATAAALRPSGTTAPAPTSTPSDGRGSFSRLRVVHRRDDEPAPKPKPEPERDDAFERFRTAKDDIDF